MRSLALNLLLSGMLFVAPRALQAASFTPLGFVPDGGYRSFVYGVSGDGSTVVGAGYRSTTQFPGLADLEAFVWDATNGLQVIGGLAGGGLNSAARAVSADGSTVVGSASSGSGQEAFIWDATNGMQGLGDLAGGNFGSSANGVSADGSTVSGNGNSGNGPEAFIWDATNGMQGLGDFAGGIFDSSTSDISADGSTVVGRSSNDEISPGGGLGFEAFIWDASNGMQGLGDFPGGYYLSSSSAVSADGSVVIGSGSSATGEKTFIWDASNGMRELIDPSVGDPLFSRLLVEDISADGSIVVGQGTWAVWYVTATVWDAAHGSRRLQDVLTSLGVDLAGWDLQTATGVSADGTTIVGYGFNPNGRVEGFVAVIPEIAFPPPVPSLSPIGVTTLLGLLALVMSGRRAGHDASRR